MADDLKNFKGGGMDNDSAPDEIDVNDYNSAYNVRLTGTISGESGEVTNIESNELITTNVQVGINKTIGCAPFEVVAKAYSFGYNSQNLDTIREFDPYTQVETVIFTNKTDSGGIDVLQLDPQYYVNDIKLIQGKYLVFTDDNSQPCYINLDRLKDGSLGVITQDDFRLIKAQPLITPTSAYSDDEGRSTNLMASRLFQFIEQYVGLDYEYSAWSTISKRKVPINQLTPASGTNVTKDNNLIVTVSAGSNRVKTINVGARYDMLDWFLIKSIDRSTVLTLPATISIATEILEAYDPVTNLYSFVFYNDGLYVNIDVLETDLDYDHVPTKVGTMEVLNGSILSLGDITEGYDKPISILTAVSSTYNPNITVPSAEYDTLRITYTDSIRISGSHKRRMYVGFSGLPREGDIITIRTSDIRDANAAITYTYTVPLSQVDDLNAAINSLQVQIPNSSTFTLPGYKQLNFIGSDYYEISVASITLFNAGSGIFKSIPALKGNSAYQIALAYYDRYGRYYPLVDGGSIKTLSYGKSHGLTPLITWNLAGDPPDGAEGYQILISENNTHLTTLFVDAVLSSSDSSYWIFNINPLKNFNEKNTSSVLNYEYSDGDRVTIHWNQTDNLWYDGFSSATNPTMDLDVVGYDEGETNFLLKVRKMPVSFTGTITAKNLLIEIYSPKKRTTTTNDVVTYNSNVFYYIGENFTITNGLHDTTTGVITDGDAYFKTRELAKATDLNDLDTFIVEDFHFSDFCTSNYTSYGRSRIMTDELGAVNKSACIRYSGEFLVGSQINGITRFFTERIYGEGAGETSSNYGAVNKLYQRDNYLICIQELKVGHIPIYASILENQDGVQNITISDEIFGKIRYIQSGTWGMGGAKESFAYRQDGTVYFVDTHNSIPVRDGYDGVRPIGGKMTKFFRETIQTAYQAGRKIIGYYDNYNDEYVVSIEVDGDILTYFTFNSSDWAFTDTYTIDPSSLLQVGVATNGTVSINTTTGKAIFTPTNNVTGSAGFAFSFVDGSVIIKNSCGVITAGSTNVDDFVFIDLTDQELSTLLESNTILVSGNTIPSPISITGGEYSVNGGSFTSISGFVNAGDLVVVRQTSSASFETETNAVLTIGNQSDSFDVTTRDENTLNLQCIFTDVPVTPDPQTSYDRYYFNFDVYYNDTDELIGAQNIYAGYLSGYIPCEIDLVRAADCYVDLSVTIYNAIITTGVVRLELVFNGVTLFTNYIPISNDEVEDNATVAAVAAGWVNIDLSAAGLLELIGYND